MDLKLRGKSVLVTGGSRGIGREVALAFADEGARVAICSRGEARLLVTADEIRQRGGECLSVVADLAEPGACDRLVEQVVAAFGGIDVLVNNAEAGMDPTRAELSDIIDDQLLARVGAKALVGIRCSRAALPHLKTSHGRIVFIAGSSAKMVMRGPEQPWPEENTTIAGLANAMITNFAKSLGEEVAKDQVLVNVIHPHITRTDRYRARITKRATEMGLGETKAEADLASYVPIGRIIEPRDIAPLVILLSSPLNGAITGQAISVDGGAFRGIEY